MKTINTTHYKHHPDITNKYQKRKNYEITR